MGKRFTRFRRLGQPHFRKVRERAGEANCLSDPDPDLMRYKNGQYKPTKQFPILGIIYLMFLFGFIIYGSHLTVKYEFISPLASTPAKAEITDFKMTYKVSEPDPAQPTPIEVAQIVIDEFEDLGPQAVAEALQISFCESKWHYDGYNDGNTNGSNDGGVFQANSIHQLPDTIRFNARSNIRWAKDKYVRDGNWNAWSCKL